jgi:hypothetical protein
MGDALAGAVDAGPERVEDRLKGEMPEEPGGDEDAETGQQGIGALGEGRGEWAKLGRDSRDGH